MLISTVNLLASVACLGTLYAYIEPAASDLSLFPLLTASSQGVTGVMLYYMLWHLVRICCTSRQWRRRMRDWLHGTKHGHVVYTSSGYVDGGTTDLVQGVPRLTMDSVWNLVYGLGCGLYVCTYTLMGLDPICIASFTFGLCMVCAYEVVFPPVFRVIPRVELHLTPCVALMSLVATVLVAGERFAAPDILSTAIYQLILPCLAPLFLLSVKSQRRFTIGSIMETCEFGLPHAFILALVFLAATAMHTDPPPATRRLLTAVGTNLTNTHSWVTTTPATPLPAPLPFTPLPLSLLAATPLPLSLLPATTLPALLPAALLPVPKAPTPLIVLPVNSDPAPTTPPPTSHPAPTTPPPTSHPAPTTPPPTSHPAPTTPPPTSHPAPTTPPQASDPAPAWEWPNPKTQRTLMFTLLAPLVIVPATLLVVGAVLQYRTADVLVCLGIALVCKEVLATSKSGAAISPANAWGMVLISLAFTTRLFSRIDTDTPPTRPVVAVDEEGGGEESSSLV